MTKTAYVVGIVALLLVVGYWTWGSFAMRTMPGWKLVNGKMVVENCQKPRNKNAAMVCPVLFCQRAAYASGRLHQRPTFYDEQDKSFENGRLGIFTGAIDYESPAPEHAPRHYRCVMKGDDVLKVGLYSDKEWLQLFRSGKLWKR